jgi:hypothetical protein
LSCSSSLCSFVVVSVDDDDDDDDDNDDDDDDDSDGDDDDADEDDDVDDDDDDDDDSDDDGDDIDDDNDNDSSADDRGGSNDGDDDGDDGDDDNDDTVGDSSSHLVLIRLELLLQNSCIGGCERVGGVGIVFMVVISVDVVVVDFAVIFVIDAVSEMELIVLPGGYRVSSMLVTLCISIQSFFVTNFAASLTQLASRAHSVQ